MLTRQLKNAIADSGLSIYRIAKDSRIPQPVLQRFAAGERDIKLATAAKLAAYFGFVLCLTKERKPMRKNRETFIVEGRKIIVATGEKTQTINICHAANQEGQYEEVQRFVERFAVDAAWITSYGRISTLKEDLRRKADHQLRQLAGL